MAQIRKEEALQAVLVADNFNENFMPITQDVNSVRDIIVYIILLDVCNS